VSHSYRKLHPLLEGGFFLAVNHRAATPRKEFASVLTDVPVLVRGEGIPQGRGCPSVMRANSRKKTSIGQRQRDLAMKLNKAGLLSLSGLEAVRKSQ
jgi:hypothetical protein